MNNNVEVKRFVNTRFCCIFNVVIVFVSERFNFQDEIRRLFEATSKVKAPDASLFNDLKLFALVTANNLVLDVILFIKRVKFTKK